MMLRRLIAAGLLVGLVIAPALEIRAQILPQILFQKATSAPAGYTGPGDVVSGATAFWSPSRAYSAAKRGTTAMTVCTALDAQCVAVASDATTGIVPVPNPGGLGLCNNTTIPCTIKTLNDQTGNGNDVTQATIANRPTLVVATLGSATVYAQFVGATPQILVSSTSSAFTKPFTAIDFSERNGAFTTTGAILGFKGTNTGEFQYSNATNTVRIINLTTLSATAADSAFHSIIGVFNNTTSALVVDGSATSGASGSANVASSQFCIADFSGCTTGTAPGTMLFTEGGWYQLGFNSTQYGNMNTNQATFY